MKKDFFYCSLTEDDIIHFREALEKDFGHIELSDPEIAEISWNTIHALSLLRATSNLNESPCLTSDPRQAKL